MLTLWNPHDCFESQIRKTGHPAASLSSRPRAPWTLLLFEIGNAPRMTFIEPHHATRPSYRGNAQTTTKNTDWNCDTWNRICISERPWHPDQYSELYSSTRIGKTPYFCYAVMWRDMELSRRMPTCDLEIRNELKTELNHLPNLWGSFSRLCQIRFVQLNTR